MDFTTLLNRRYFCRSFSSRPILPGTAGYELVALINVGYPTEDSQPSPMHGVRKPMGEFVTKVE